MKSIKVKLLLTLFVFTSISFAETYCDSILKVKVFYNRYFQNLTQVSATMEYFHFGEGFDEPIVNNKGGFNTKIESKIHNDNVMFWKYLVKNGDKKVHHNYPCTTNKISAPKFTCGCAFVNFKYYFISGNDTISCLFNNCNIDSGTLSFFKSKSRFELSINDKQVSGLLKHITDILNKIIPQNHVFCGDDKKSMNGTQQEKVRE